MNTRVLIAIAAAAGLAVEACRQEVMQVSYSWSEVLAGTLTPAGSPNYPRASLPRSICPSCGTSLAPPP